MAAPGKESTYCGDFPERSEGTVVVANRVEASLTQGLPSWKLLDLDTNTDTVAGTALPPQISYRGVAGSSRLHSESASWVFLLLMSPS